MAKVDQKQRYKTKKEMQCKREFRQNRIQGKTIKINKIAVSYLIKCAIHFQTVLIIAKNVHITK